MIAWIVGGLLAVAVGAVQEVRVRRMLARAVAADTARELAEHDARTADADRARTEEIIRGLHVELDAAVGDLARCSTPDAVRERLRALLAPPPAGVPADQPAPDA